MKSQRVLFMKSQLIAALLCLYPLGSAYAAECFIATRNDVPGDLNDMIHKNKYDFRGYALTCNYLKTFNAGIEVASATFTHDDGRITEVTIDTLKIINGYFPNGGSRADGTEMLSYKLNFYDQII